MTAIVKTRNGKFQAFVRLKGHKPRIKTFNSKTAAKRWADALEDRLKARLTRPLKASPDDPLEGAGSIGGRRGPMAQRVRCSGQVPRQTSQEGPWASSSRGCECHHPYGVHPHAP